MRTNQFVLFGIFSFIFLLVAQASIVFADDSVGVCKIESTGTCLDLTTSTVCSNQGGQFFAGASLSDSVFREANCKVTCCCYSQTGTSISSRLVYGNQDFCSATYSNTEVKQIQYFADVSAMESACSTACNLPPGSPTTETPGIGDGTPDGSGPVVTPPPPIQEQSCVGSATLYGNILSTYALPSQLKIHVKNLDESVNTCERSILIRDDGTYRLTGLPAGQILITLDINNDEWSYAPVTTSLTTYDNKNVNLTLLPVNVRTITGSVTNRDGSVLLSNALVRIKNSPYATVTNAQGVYTLRIISSATSFIIQTSASNYQTKEDTITFTGATQTHNVALDSSLCESVPAKLSLFAVSNIKGQPGVNLSWQTSQCESLISSFRIYRCLGSNATTTECRGGNLVGYDVISDKTKRNFVDSQTDWDKNYTYAVEVLYSNGLKSWNGNLSIFTGNRACENVIDNFNYCSSANPVTVLQCNANNVQATIETCSGVNTLCLTSYENNQRNAQCRPPALCYSSTSDNFFGLFDTQTTCREFRNAYNNQACYFDKLNTVVDTCLSCKPAMTCGDYKTQNACESNFCGASIQLNGCQWQGLGSSGNTGVCVEKQNPTCETCAKGPFGICDQLTCGAISTLRVGQLGDSAACMFNGEACKSCAQTTCYDYKTEQACLGNANGQRSFNTYTNQITNPSGDSCGVQLCAWTGNTCVKDADGSARDDCTEVQFMSGINPEIQRAQCRNDKTPPITYTDIAPSIDIFTKNKDILFLSLDTGRTGRFQVNQTRFCVMNSQTESIVGDCSDTTRFAFANAQPNGFFKGVLENTSNWVDGETYTLRYYSIDYALNREVVKEKEFTAKKSLVNISDIIIEHVSNAQTKSILVQVVVAEPAICEIQYPFVFPQTGDGLAPSSIPQTNTFALVHSKLFTNPQSGNQFVKVTCKNSDGAHAVEVKSILTQGRIFEVLPAVSTTTTVTFTHKTYEFATCAYSNESFNSLAQGQGYYTSERIGDEYRFTKTLTFEPGLYTHYIKCDFNGKSEDYDHYFAVNPNSSEVIFTGTNSVTPLLNQWYRSTGVQALCDGGISSAFSSCVSGRYCVAPYNFAQGGEQTCNPQTAVSFTQNRATLSQSINTSKVYCIVATESSATNGRQTQQECLNIFIDGFAPNISKVQISPTVSQNMISVSGELIDATNYVPTLSLNGNNPLTIVDANQPIANMHLKTTITRLQTSSQQLDIVLRGTFTDGVGVRLTNSKVSFGTFSGNSFTVIGERDYVVNLNTQYSLEISTKGSAVNVSFGTSTSQVQLSATTQKTNAGPIFVRSNGQYSLRDTFVVDTDISVPVLLYAKINGNEQLLGELSSFGSFSVQSQLTQDINIGNGREFLLEVYAKDIVGQSSDVISQRVVYDVEGPYVTNFRIEPANTQQVDKSYVEYGENARITVTARDVSGLSHADIIVSQISKRVQTVSGNQITGINSTVGMPAGKNDVLLETYDIFGNKQQDVYEDFLTIRNTKNPNTQIVVADEFFTDSDLVDINLTTLGNSCVATYTGANGQSQSQSFVDGAGSLKTVTLTNLPLTQNEEERIKVLITCQTQTGETFSHVVTVYVDKRSPIVSIQLTPSDDTLFTFTSRDSKRYELFKPISQRQLYVTSDEMVRCEFPELNAIMPGYLNSYTMPLIISDQNSIYTTMICTDRAGNVAVQKEITVSLDTTSDLTLLDFGVVYDEGQATIFAKTARPLTCTLDGQAMSRSIVANHYYSQIAYNPQKAPGTHEYELICSLDGKTVRQIGTVVLDRTAPVITLTSTDSVRISANSVYSVTGTSSETVTVAVYNKGLRNVVKAPTGQFSIPIPVDMGLNEVTIIFSDGAKNTHTENMLLFRGDGEQSTSKPSLASYSANAQSLVVSYPRAISSARLDLTTLEGVFVSQIIGVSSNGQITFTLPTANSLASPQPKTYIGKVQLDSHTDYVVFTLDSLSERLTIVNPTEYRSTKTITNVSLSVPYVNLISNSELSLNDDVLSFVGKYGEYEKKINLENGINVITFSSQNDLHKDLVAQQTVIYDAQVPSATISIYPIGGSKATVKNPQFEVLFRTPTAIVDAYIQSTNGNRISQVSYPSSFVSRAILQTDSNMPNGNYELVIQTRNVWGQTTNDKQVFRFELAEIAHAVRVISPWAGFSATPNINITLATAHPSVCGFAISDTVSSQTAMDSPPFTLLSGDTYTHSGTVTINEQLVSIRYTFRCISMGGDSKSVTMNLTYDPRKPDLVASVTNSIDGIIASRDGTAELVATTSLASRCKFSTTQTTFDQMTPFMTYDKINTRNTQQLYGLDDGNSYTYYVQCESGAGIISDQKVVSFKVDRSYGQLISIVNPSPGSAYSTRSQEILVRTIVPTISNGCTYGLSSTTITTALPQTNQNRTQFSVPAREFNVGENTLFVQCIFSGQNGGSHIEKTSSTFYIDTTPPEFISITTPEAVNKNQLPASWEFRDNESHIAEYEYAIGIAPYPNTGWNSTLGLMKTSSRSADWILNLTNNTKYYWSIRAINRAGLNSSFVSSNGTLVILQNLTPLVNNTPVLVPNRTNETVVTPPVLTTPEDDVPVVDERPPVRNQIDAEADGSNIRQALIGGSLIFILALGIIGSALGYTAYQKKKERETKSTLQPSQTTDFESKIGTRPTTVQDKLKLALQEQLRKQKEKDHMQRSFTAFDKTSLESQSDLNSESPLKSTQDSSVKSTSSLTELSKKDLKQPASAIDKLKNIKSSHSSTQKRVVNSTSKSKKSNSANSIDRLKKIAGKKK